MNLPASQRKPARPAWLGGCLVLLAAGALFTVLLMILLSVGSKGLGTGAGLTAGHRVGLITLEGEIMDSREFTDELERLEEDGRMRALVVRIDSPGGGVAATQEIHEALLDFRRRTDFPVVASLGSLAASGGYYVACAADRIVTEPGTLTGSIGVIFSFTDASELMKKIGLRSEVIKSGAKKDFGAYWRSLTEEERAMLDGVVADVYDQFTRAVAEGRKLPLEKVRGLADGRIFTGRQALTEGLADTMGFSRNAVEIAAGLAGLPADTPVLEKRRFAPEWLDLLRRLAGQAHVLSEGRPQLMYR
jgi:protease IV